MEAHNPERAAEAFAIASRLDPDDTDLVLYQAQALKDSGKIAAARALIVNMSGAGQSAPAKLLLGDIEENSGNFEQAAAHYARAVEIAPTATSPSWHIDK